MFNMIYYSITYASHMVNINFALWLDIPISGEECKGTLMSIHLEELSTWDIVDLFVTFCNQ